MKTKQRLDNTDFYTIKAAEYFGIDLNDVEPKHRKFIKEQEFAKNYGHRGVPLRTYTVDESGFVVFDYATVEKLLIASKDLFHD